MTSSEASYHLPQYMSQNPMTDMYCNFSTDIAYLCEIIKSIPDLMVQKFKPGSGNTIFVIQSKFEDYKLSVTASNCIGDDIKFSVQIFSPDTTVKEISQQWVIRYYEESYDRSTNFITKRNFVRLMDDKGIVLRNSRDDSLVATNSPHLASPTLLHGSGIYFPQLDQEGVDNLISTIDHMQALDTLVRLSAQQYNHSALLAPREHNREVENLPGTLEIPESLSGTIPLLGALISCLQSDNKNILKKSLIIIANFASCEGTHVFLIEKALLDSLVAQMSYDDPTIKALLEMIITFLYSTHRVNLEQYNEQLQSL